MRARWVVAWSFLVSGLAFPPVASAGHPQERQGFWISIGIGAGSAQVMCDDCAGNRETAGVARVALGGTASLGDGTVEAFRASGLAHLLAVSGGNVVLLVAAVLGLAWLVAALRAVGATPRSRIGQLFLIGRPERVDHARAPAWTDDRVAVTARALSPASAPASVAGSAMSTMDSSTSLTMTSGSMPAAISSRRRAGLADARMSLFTSDDGT